MALLAGKLTFATEVVCATSHIHILARQKTPGCRILLCALPNRLAGAGVQYLAVDSLKIEHEAQRRILLYNLDTPRSAVDILASDPLKNQLLAALPHAESQ